MHPYMSQAIAQDRMRESHERAARARIAKQAARSRRASKVAAAHALPAASSPFSLARLVPSQLRAGSAVATVDRTTLPEQLTAADHERDVSGGRAGQERQAAGNRAA